MVDGEEWPTSCDFFQTIISDTVTGIECDATRIYDNAHPYPKKPGNVVAAFMHTLALEEVSLPFGKSGLVIVIRIILISYWFS